VTGAWFMGCRGVPEGLQRSLEQRGAIFSDSFSSDIGFTQQDIESRIADLESSVNQLEEWSANLRRTVSDIRVSLLSSAQTDIQAINAAETLSDLANELQTTCINARQSIYSYRVGFLTATWTADECTAEYDNINEQLVRIGNFIRVVQIILVDVPGFIARST
jgi:hypothetical protein